MNARVGDRRAIIESAWLAILPGASLAQATEDIRDIRGPKTLSASWALPAILAAAVLAALWVYILWRRRQRATQTPTLTLAELTLQRLEATRPLMHPHTARAFGIAASELIRDYIEKRFEVVATQRTTEEFLQALLQNPQQTLVRHRPLLADFLQQCDLVKFAGHSLATTDLNSLFQSARRFVLETGETAGA
jgi:hypothetical protein